MSDEFRICCNLLHVKTATWIIAIVHFIECAVTIVSGVLYYLGITDGTSRYQSAVGALSTGGWAQRYGFAGLMVAAIVWMIFICFLIYGLKKNRAIFVLLHLIYSFVIFILFVTATVLSFIDGRTLGNTAWFILLAIVLFLLLYVEYKCWQFLKYSYVPTLSASA